MAFPIIGKFDTESIRAPMPPMATSMARDTRTSKSTSTGWWMARTDRSRESKRQSPNCLVPRISVESRQDWRGLLVQLHELENGAQRMSRKS